MQRKSLFKLELARGIEPPTCGLQKPDPQDFHYPTTSCPTKGKRRTERGLAHGFLALSCIGCDGSVLRRGTLSGTPIQEPRGDPWDIRPPASLCGYRYRVLVPGLISLRRSRGGWEACLT